MPTGIVLLALTLLLYALTGFYIYRAIFEREPRLPFMPKPARPDQLTPWDAYDDQIEKAKRWFEAKSPESLEMKSRDGLALRAKYLPCLGSRNTIVLVHGYRSEGGVHDFACVLKPYHDAGLNLLVIEHRAHARSEGSIITFGVAERLDVVDWVHFINRRYAPERVVLGGISMGASTVLMALAQALPANVVGAIADCGYTAPRAIIHYVMKRDYRLPGWLLPGAALWFRLRTGRSLDEASALESVKRARVPILFLHGEADVYVPVWMGRANYEACASEKWLITVPGAGHGVSFMVDREKCAQALDKFLRRVLQ